MTNGPTPTQPPRNEAEYARKLALAILSTLESKGLLTRLDVDTILHAAHRAATTQAVPTLPANNQPASNQPTSNQTAIPNPVSASAAPTPLQSQVPAQPILPTNIQPASQLAQPGAAPAQAAQQQPSPQSLSQPSGPIGPAILGTRWARPDGAAASVPAASAEVTALPSEITLPSASTPAPTTELVTPEPTPAAETSNKPAAAATPLVIDFKLD